VLGAALEEAAEARPPHENRKRVVPRLRRWGFGNIPPSAALG